MAINYQEFDRDKAFRKARGHSRAVGLLKFLLPLCAISATGLYLIPTKASLTIEGKGTASVDISDSGRLINPKFQGVDKTNGKYKVEAAYAVPDFKQPHLFKLHKIQANAENKSQGWVKMEAAEGLFNRHKEKLDLTSGIKISTRTGLAANLKSAQVYIKKQVIESDQPVHVKMPNGTVHAGGMIFHTSSSVLQFRNNVQVQLVNNQPTRRRAKAQEGLGAMFQNNREPIDVASQTLNINNKTRTAVFQGQVSARQSDLALQANSLKIDYQGQGQQGLEQQGLGNRAENANNQAKQSIRQIIAQDNVLITTGNGQEASAQTSISDNQKQLVTLQNNVVVKQGANSLKGQKLVIDINKRHSYFPAGAGRVQGVFVPPKNDKPKKKRRPVQQATNGESPSIGESFSSFAEQSDEPLFVASNRLDIYDLKKYAIFKGNVQINRGQNTIRSGYLKLDYVGSAPISGAQDGRSKNAGTQIKRIIAKNSVLITTPNNQSVTSDQAVFNVAANTIVIQGNVVLTQNNNVLKGNKLVINLKTGEYSFSTGRDKVRAVFTPENFKLPQNPVNR